MQFKGAIFDVDGVIIDTAHIHFRAWKRLFKDYNIDLSDMTDAKSQEIIMDFVQNNKVPKSLSNRNDTRKQLELMNKR